MAAVLIAIDHPHILSQVEAKIYELGYEPRRALTANMVLQELKQRDIDVLIADLDLARRSGTDVLRMAKQVSPNTRLLLMSDQATAQDYKEAIKRGAVELLTPPFSDEDLTRAIRKAVECNEGFQASVHGLSLIDILQMIHQSRRSMIVRIGSKGAAIHMQDGEIIHASAPPLLGIDALKALMTARSGSLATGPYEEGRHTIDQAFEPLLLTILRQIDETNRDDPGSIQPWQEPITNTGSEKTPSDITPIAPLSKVNSMSGRTASFPFIDEGPALPTTGSVSSPIQARIEPITTEFVEPLIATAKKNKGIPKLPIIIAVVIVILFCGLLSFFITDQDSEKKDQIHSLDHPFSSPAASPPSPITPITKPLEPLSKEQDPANQKKRARIKRNPPRPAHRDKRSKRTRKNNTQENPSMLDEEAPPARKSTKRRTRRISTIKRAAKRVKRPAPASEASPSEKLSKTKLRSSTRKKMKKRRPQIGTIRGRRPSVGTLE